MKIIKIGRNPGNDVTIEDGSVSRVHCQIVYDDNGNFIIVDSNSTNGTFVNGMRVHGEMRLNPGDSVRIGNTVLPWQNYFANELRNANHAGGNQNANNIDINIIQQQPHAQSSVQSPTLKPNNYMVWAILSTILCCLPFGLCSVVHASRVDSYWESGNYDAANDAARKAKKWFWWSFAPGLIIYIATFIIYFTVGFAVFGAL